MTVTVRFAPSPTGLLHIGNARTALLNWLFARRHGGRFVLRLDDTDRERSTEEFARRIVEDLAWLGIEPDIVVRQSDRLDLYAAAADRLRAAGRLYGCYETAEELERRRKRQMAQGLPPVYDRAGLALQDDDRARLEGEGRSPHWRFLLDRRRVAWEDLCRGRLEVDTATLSDPVLVRGDGSYLYTLPSVVDDVDLEVTHVVRGEDHVTNTAAQIEIFEALDAAPPAFGHHNLLAGREGEALSKRTGALSLAALREQGFEPGAVASLAVLLGSAGPVEAHARLDELVPLLDLARLSRGTARFDPGELQTLNRALLRELPYADARPRLAAAGADLGEPFWVAVRGNLERLRDAVAFVPVVAGEVDVPEAEDPELVVAALNLLPAAPWDETTWQGWTAAVREATGRKGKALFRPLRLALTGLESGPELKLLLPLIGEERARARLSAATAGGPGGNAGTT